MTYKLIVLSSCVVIVLVIVLVAIISTSFSSAAKYEHLDTLELVHVLFRHGDRTNDKDTVYPTDPNRNYMYPPYGFGRLTNEGKLRVFNVGKALNEKYSPFLTAENPEDVLYATSTASPRAIVSMQLLLSGLFPPSYSQLWNRDLIWQPLPFKITPRSHDKVLQGYKCPNYRKLYEEYVRSAENQNNMKNYTQLFAYLAKQTGWPMKNLENVAYVNCNFQIEEEFGLQLPKWSESVWPEPIKSAQHQCYYQMSATNLMMKYTTGFLLKKILRDTKAKIHNELPVEKKLFLYSAHDYNVGYFLKALDLFDRSRNPKYASYIVVELHKIKNVHYFKILYENYNYNEPEVLNIPNCGELCSVNKFEKLMLDYLPNDDLMCGTESSCSFS